MAAQWRLKEEWQSSALVAICSTVRVRVMLLQSITQSACFSTDSGKPGESCMLEVGTGCDSQRVSKVSVVLPLQHMCFFFPHLPEKPPHF